MTKRASKLEPTTQLTGAKRGRKHRPYPATWGENIDGLARLPDGRWRINATGQRFSEPDERRAVERFRQWERMSGHGMVQVEASVENVFGRGVKTFRDLVASDDVTAFLNWDAESEVEFVGEVEGEAYEEAKNLKVRLPIPERLLGPWLRWFVLEHGDYAARLTGIPQLARIASLDIPADSPELETLCEAYAKSGVGRISARNARRTVKEFVAITGINTLREMTVERLKDYREKMKKRYAEETLDGMFGRIKTVVGYGRKEGINPAEVRAALDKLAVLHTGRKEKKTFDPTPIDPADFRKLLGGADPEMRVVLLLSLNCCLYLSEALAVEWCEIDLDKGTYRTRRNKTGVRRAGVLWPETVAAIRAVPRRGASPYVFTSNRGTKYAYGVNAYRDKFGRLRKAVGVAGGVEYSFIRDGAYSACCSAGVALALCRALAGHQLDGETDHYVARNPAMVKPACDAVYAAYAPFPDSKPAIKIGRPSKAKAA